MEEEVGRKIEGYMTEYLGTARSATTPLRFCGCSVSKTMRRGHVRYSMYMRACRYPWDRGVDVEFRFVLVPWYRDRHILYLN